MDDSFKPKFLRGRKKPKGLDLPRHKVIVDRNCSYRSDITPPKFHANVEREAREAIRAEQLAEEEERQRKRRRKSSRTYDDDEVEPVFNLPRKTTGLVHASIDEETETPIACGLSKTRTSKRLSENIITPDDVFEVLERKTAEKSQNNAPSEPTVVADVPPKIVKNDLSKRASIRSRVSTDKSQKDAPSEPTVIVDAPPTIVKNDILKRASIRSRISTTNEPKIDATRTEMVSGSRQSVGNKGKRVSRGSDSQAGGDHSIESINLTIGHSKNGKNKNGSKKGSVDSATKNHHSISPKAPSNVDTHISEESHPPVPIVAVQASTKPKPKNATAFDFSAILLANKMDSDEEGGSDSIDDEEYDVDDDNQQTRSKTTVSEMSELPFSSRSNNQTSTGRSREKMNNNVADTSVTIAPKKSGRKQFYSYGDESSLTFTKLTHSTPCAKVALSGTLFKENVDKTTANNQDQYQDQHKDQHQDQYQDQHKYQHLDQYQDQHEDQHQDQYQDQHKDQYPDQHKDQYQDEPKDQQHKDQDHEETLSSLKHYGEITQSKNKFVPTYKPKFRTIPEELEMPEFLPSPEIIIPDPENFTPNCRRSMRTRVKGKANIIYDYSPNTHLRKVVAVEKKQTAQDAVFRLNNENLIREKKKLMPKNHHTQFEHSTIRQLNLVDESGTSSEFCDVFTLDSLDEFQNENGRPMAENDDYGIRFLKINNQQRMAILKINPLSVLHRCEEHDTAFNVVNGHLNVECKAHFENVGPFSAFIIERNTDYKLYNLLNEHAYVNFTFLN